MKNKLEETVRNVIREFANDLANAPTIEITPVEQDERSGKKQINAYNVNYQKNINGELIEIEGTLSPHHTGRSIEYGFEPGYFTDGSPASTYWDENWETIEDEIRNKFYDLKY
jgi:hypothetical protein